MRERSHIREVCIAVKWYIPEIFSQEAMGLLAPAYSLVSPDSLLGLGSLELFDPESPDADEHHTNRTKNIQ